ncbi:MAG: DNA-processing protein DprA [Oscillospiraceae bacterium]|nr:DNA-processing protein DprA [Oscillospiraceae bacterium]
MIAHWIWLATRPGLNDRMKRIVLDAFSDAEDVYFADREAYATVEGVSSEIVDALADKDLKEAKKILDVCMTKGIKICTYQDEEYPARLKNIVDPPLVLYYKGQIPDLDSNPVIGVVGTRKASGYGMNTAHQMGYQIARCGGIVVSGAADGIDAMAMQGALLAGTPVVGVLGCGADVIYPTCNRKLYADTEKRGCLLTEFPPGTRPLRWNFPKRNRIISGLSNGVLVVEAPERSGALITARAAADQGRDVFVVPGNIGVESCVGSNALLREGAISVSCGWDVVSEYQFLYPDKISQGTLQTEKPERKVAQTPRVPEKAPVCDRKKENKPIDNCGAEAYSDQRNVLPELTPEQKQILQLLDKECLVDDLISQLKLPTGKVLSALTMLQIKGLIRQLPGKRVERCK